MPVLRPILVRMPPGGVAFAESVHGPGFRMAERADAFHKLIYVLQGSVELIPTEFGRPLSAQTGTVLCVAAGVRHRIADREPPTLLLLCFATELLERDDPLLKLWGNLTSGRATVRTGGHWGPRFEGLWRAGIAEQAGDRPGRDVALRAAAENILVAVARAPADAPANAATQRVAAVVGELAGTFYEPWSLERACARAGMSRRHFSKLFRAQTGKTFLDHLTALRLDHAAALLRDNRHSIIGAAFSCGYGDLSHFYRLFKAHFGEPPRTWLQRNQSTKP
jgi:AraC-like DNA-binding protein/quercetin dioxygenase-like cupin family protein